MSTCIHEMYEAFCGVCRPPRLPRSARQHTTTFVARYGGWCKYCGDRIEEGDNAGYVFDELACESCVRDAR